MSAARGPQAEARAPARPVLSLRGITKRFGPLIANDDIGFEVAPGEIVALLGENGAGKTTLMNIIFGHYVADEGEVSVAGPDGALAPLPPGSAEAALRAGVGMVHQHFTLAENLTAFENIVLGTESLWRLSYGGGGARARVEAIAASSGLDVDLDAPVSRLSVGEKQRVEILKALYRDARVLILDEPTAVLTPQEADGLAATVRALAARGLAVIFISHKLAEVVALCHRILVLRGGRLVADRAAAGCDRATLADLMVGRSIEVTRTPRRPGGPPVLVLDHASADGERGRGALREASLVVHGGEIVGVAGVSGNGQGALAALVAGLAAPRSGRLEVLGGTIRAADPAAMVRRGVGRIPEDRHREGSIGRMSIAENLMLESVRDGAFQRLGFIRRRAAREHAEEAIAAFDVRCPGPDAPIRLLSGGNMQKVILARALERSPMLILANQPTRGLDVAATADVHRRLIAARDRGAGVLLISEDLDEIFVLADRIAAIHHGRLTPSFATETLDTRAVGLMMAGHDPTTQEPEFETAGGRAP
ncbi:ABC transporter ATP-binding protein [Alsobacter sp. SYSU M60028]|uniref:ABC transporter ATP-binding protein n=1 Tax=Alsobacter ponti TaxID=2962936 RepID=A0ABT1L7R5_9HYPH|nr:ABC transporter ATP-binding protein [Alsobacter ponti]MCP8937091.1 ABC transporter ATP-binding protein [Alsobacter ponti]